MNENRRQILQMLSEGKITADEAARLITALDSCRTADAADDESARPAKKPKYLRVVVDVDDPRSSERPVKVNIRVPMQLLRAGVRLGSLIPVQAREQMNQALRKQGVPFDIGQIKPENLDDLIDHLNDLTVDVDEETTKVRIFSE
jgi:hypothetical protein